MAMRAVPFLSTPFPVQKPRPFYPRTGLSHFFKYREGNSIASMSMTFWKFPSGSSVRSHSARTASSRMGRACPAMPTKSRAWMSQICQICMVCWLSGRSCTSEEVQAPQGGSSPSSAHVSRHSSQLGALSARRPHQSRSFFLPPPSRGIDDAHEVGVYFPQFLDHFLGEGDG